MQLPHQLGYCICMVSVFTALLQFYNCVILLQAKELHCNKPGLMMPGRNSPMVFALCYLYLSHIHCHFCVHLPSFYFAKQTINSLSQLLLVQHKPTSSRFLSLLNAQAPSPVMKEMCRKMEDLSFLCLFPGAVTIRQVKGQVLSWCKPKDIHWLQWSSVCLYQQRRQS